MERLTRIERPCSKQAKSSQRIVRLQVVTLAWMLVECCVALFSAWEARSPALLAFGSDSFVEVLSAIVVLLQFVPKFALAPKPAARISGVLLLVLAGIVAFSAAVAIITGIRPDGSWSGIAVTVAALAIMPVLARAKRAAARQAGNRALAADAVQSATCAYLAVITLGGLLINAAFHVQWIDPVAGLVAVPIICIEGMRALRGDACGCCA